MAESPRAGSVNGGVDENGCSEIIDLNPRSLPHQKPE